MYYNYSMLGIDRQKFKSTFLQILDDDGISIDEISNKSGISKSTLLAGVQI